MQPGAGERGGAAADGSAGGKALDAATLAAATMGPLGEEDRVPELDEATTTRVHAAVQRHSTAHTRPDLKKGGERDGRPSGR